jgi:GAF domain-containing protein
MEDRPTKKEMNRLAEMAARNSRKVKLYERIFHGFTQPDRLEANLSTVLDGLIELTDCEAGSVALIDPIEEDVYFALARGPVAEEVLKIRLEQGQGIIGACMSEKKTLSVSDVTSDPRFAAEVSEALGFTTRSVLSSPIIFKGQVLGAIELINRGSGDDWPGYETELIEYICRAAGTYIYLAHVVDPEGAAAE